ncbi:MAG TPA: hypothetical protein VJX67_00445, partial [Blastocatellia bacterium]|nr:hypothetical protein [Blastocatellia bacterium]
MKKIKTSIVSLTTALMFFYSISGVPLGFGLRVTAKADSNKGHLLGDSAFPGRRKISADLEQMVRGNRRRRIPVIIQTNGAPQVGLMSAVHASSGEVRRIYSSVHALHVKVTASAVETLASRVDVKYIS